MQNKRMRLAYVSSGSVPKKSEKRFGERKRRGKGKGGMISTIDLRDGMKRGGEQDDDDLLW